MIEEKNIDRLFQEKFKDFNATPNPQLWNRIEGELYPEKKKRRAVLMWWRIGGIAASLLLFISLGITFFNLENNQASKDTTTDSDNTNTFNSNSELSNFAKTNSKAIQKDVSTTADSKNLNQLKNLNQKSNLAKNDDVKFGNENIPVTNPFSNLKLLEEEFVFNFKPSIYQLPSTIEIAQEIDHSIVSDEEKDIPFDNETNAITKYIASLEKEDDKNESEKRSRWSIKPNIAPVVFNSLGNGSTIGNDFNNNSKSSDINISFGITGSYALNKRLNIRTGINKVNLGFDTNDVILFNSSSSLFVASNREFSTSSLRNVTLNNKAGNTAVISSTQLQPPNTLAVIDTNNSNASIEQRFGFIEVPLEIEYSILDKKFGVNIIGGFSALFLDNNEVFSNVNGQSTLIGEANNINSTSLSANFGLGVNYNFSKALNFNIEPTFKYQVNTFENTTGNFQPFFFGVYSGFKFKF